MASKPIPEFDLNAFSSPFRNESDRACAVLGAAVLDARLEAFYRRRLLNSKEKLLSGNGPISTFSARIRLAGALGWISEDVRYDLDQVRSIRNDFAHNADHELSFTDTSIADRCRTLRVAQVLIDANEHAASTPHKNLSPSLIRRLGDMFHPPRQRFEITVEMLAQHLHELPSNVAEYEGPCLRKELWELGSNVDIKISMTPTVHNPPDKKP